METDRTSAQRDERIFWTETRVTRLGDVSHTWRVFTLGSFLKIIYLSSTNLWVTFFHGKKLCINFDKNGLGYILGDFFTSSSGHPARNAGRQERPNFLLNGHI
jgi:hypothetical protein